MTANTTQVPVPVPVGIYVGPGGGGGAVASVTAGDASVGISPTTGAVIVEAGTLDEIATLHPPAGPWSNNEKKIEGLANGTASDDAAAFGQIPTLATTATVIGTNQDIGNGEASTIDSVTLGVGKFLLIGSCTIANESGDTNGADVRFRAGTATAVLTGPRLSSAGSGNGAANACIVVAIVVVTVAGTIVMEAWGSSSNLVALADPEVASGWDNVDTGIIVLELV